MKVVMINDCAFVAETLLKYLPPQMEKQHIKRTRGVWSKTLGIAYDVWRVKGDVFHAHYLLQDCYIAARLGKKPLIGHAHGSDLRKSLHHPLWRRVVKHNLKNCDKILVSTPDVLSIAKKFREDAEYFPNPVDSEYFYPKPFIKHDGKKKVLIASDSNWNVKGTDIAIKALSKIKDEVDVSIVRHGADFDRTAALASSLGLHLSILPKVPHQKLDEYYWNTDVVIDRFKLGSLGVISLEAIACGRPVVAYVSSEFPEYAAFPLKAVDTEEKAVDSIRNADNRLWEKEYTYFMTEHGATVVVERLLRLYEALGVS
jgi:glycosyltransferase involved in cell wall biosynthesis